MSYTIYLLALLIGVTSSVTGMAKKSRWLLALGFGILCLWLMIIIFKTQFGE